MKNYFVLPSWNTTGWFTVCYLNEVGTPTMFCEMPHEDHAALVAGLLNKHDTLAQADERARARLASFDRLLTELEGMANKMRFEDTAKLLEAK